ncbi:MAG TPA: amidohydrolase family protein [Baekduia sp.]|nr:amidohydrolase family protein [Baekduia sp.]
MSATTIMGGLVDAHAHLTLDLEDAGLAPGPGRVPINVAAAWSTGVLALRDAGSRDGIAAAQLDPARQVAAGPFLAPEGGYHAHLMVPTAPGALVEAVIAQARAGTRWIKVIADFPGADGNWFGAPANYEVDEIARAVAAAHAHGARVMAHVSGPLVDALVRAGVDSIEHGPLIEEPLLAEMAQRGTLWCPTVATIERHLAPLRGKAPAIDEQFARWPRTLPAAVALDVALLVGTDELGPRGLAAEAEALVRLGGLAPRDVVHAATAGARAALDLPAVAGDSATFDGDPAVDVTALGRVLEVRPDRARLHPAAPARSPAAGSRWCPRRSR